MLLEWRKFKGWSILEFFLSNPNTKIHIKGLARELNISPQTSNRYLRLYEAEKLLESETVGNVVQFYLNNRHALVKELKIFYFNMLLHESNFIDNLIQHNPDIINLLLYGSHASGEYSEKSDIDLLILSQSKRIDISAVKQLEKQLSKEAQVSIYTIGEWRELIKKDDPFVKSVLNKHILLYGEMNGG